MTAISRVLCSLLLMAAAERSAAAGTIAVFGDHAGRHQLATTLTEQGHTVTDVSRLPDDLAAYDSVWHVGAVRALTEVEQKRMVDFVDGGGGLYLTGEALGSDAMNTSVAKVIGQLVIAPGLELATAPEAMSGVHAFSSAAPGNLTNFPNKLSTWRTGVAGTIAGSSDRNVVARGPDGSISSAAWSDTELADGGRLIVMMDAGWLGLDDNLAAIAENFALFLERQPATPWDGATPDTVDGEPDAPRVTAADDDVDTDGVDPGDDGADDDAELAAGCSAGGNAGGGAVLGLLAVSLLALRRRRA